MTADELEKMLESQLAAQCPAKPKQLAEEEFRLLLRVAHATPLPTHAPPQTPHSNQFSVLEILGPEASSGCEEEMPESSETQPQPPLTQMGKMDELETHNPLPRRRPKLHHAPNPPEDDRHHGGSFH